MRVVASLMLVLMTVGLACADVVPVFSFDDTAVGAIPTGCRLRGTNGQSSTMAVTECEVNGQKHHCLDLNYNFAADKNPQGLDPGTKTVIVGTWRKLPDDTRRLRVTLSGDGSGHALLIGVGETGEWFNFTGPVVDWQGWRTFDIDLSGKYRDSGGPSSNGLLDPPLTLASVNLAQSAAGPVQGTLRLLSVEAVVAPPAPVDDIEIAPGGAAATGVVTLGSAAQAALQLHNPGAETVAGKLSFRLTPWEGVPASHDEQPWSLPPDQTVQVPLELPDRCGYYEVQVTLTSGEITRQQCVPLVVVPPRTERRPGRLGVGLLGLNYYDAPTRDWAAALRAVGADWTNVLLSSGELWTETGTLKADAADAADGAVKDIRSAGLDCLAAVTGLPRLLDADTAAQLAGYLPLMDALTARYPDQMIGWLLPTNSPILQPVLSARMAVDGKPRVVARVKIADLLDPSPEARALAIQRLRELAADPHYAALAFLTTNSMNTVDTPQGGYPDLTEVISAVPASLPIFYYVDQELAFPVAKQQPAQDEIMATQARDLTAALLRWLSFARPQDRLLYQGLYRAQMAIGLFRGVSRPKPSAAAFATIANLLGVATPTQSEEIVDYRLQHFITPDGPVIAISPQKRQPQSLTLRLKVNGPAWRIHYLGARDAIARGESGLPLGPDPVYLQGQFEITP